MVSEYDFVGEKFSIVKASVYMDHLLDLTDKDICEKIEELWRIYKREAELNTSANEACPLKVENI